MRVTRAQVAPLLVLLVCLFGCNAGQALRVVSVVAITTARIAAIATVAAVANAHASPRPRAEEPSADGPATPPVAPASLRDAVASVDGCTELRVIVVPPAAEDGPPPPRAVDCGGEVLLQDEEGHWRRYEGEQVPEAPAP